MTLAPAGVLRPGDWVRFDGADHLVVALTGTLVRLRSDGGTEAVVLAAYLMASPEFAVLGSDPLPAVEPFGLLDGLPAKVLEEAREWERHLVEVETGLPPDPPEGAPPRPEYDPATTTVSEREQAKAAELGAGLRTIQVRRSRYAQQGLWGLVDQRATRLGDATGRADARVVAAVRELVDAETGTSTGTRSRLIRRVVKKLEAEHGPGVVPLPGKTTFYKVIDAVASGRHTFGSAVTRRQTANRPQGVFTPTFAARPGEQVQIDSTPIDVLVLLDNGMPVRADLTIAVDVATRTICAAVLRPVGTKAVDAALLLARMLVPEPMRPGWSRRCGCRPRAAARPAAGHRRADGAGRGAAGDRAGHDRDRRREGVHLRDVHPRLRTVGDLGAAARPRHPDGQGDRGGDVRVDQHPVLPARRLLHRVEPDAARHRRRPGRGRCRSCRTCWMSGCWPGGSPARTTRCATRWLRGGCCRPNEKYAALVAAAGYLPLTLTGEDYLELLPVEWRQINAYGIRIDYRTYDCAGAGPLAAAALRGDRPAGVVGGALRPLRR